MKAVVSIIMGSTSDMPVMRKAADFLNSMKIPFEINALSAHRVPEKVEEFASNAHANGIKVIIAGAGGAAHLPGMVASKTRLPVLGVPVQSKALSGVDSLYSIVQMPRGVAVGSLAIGGAGAFNAGLLACQMLANNDPELAQRVEEFRSEQTQTILDNPDPRQS